MNLIVVKSSSELKSALHKNADEIIIEDEKLIQQLRVVGYLRKAGPIAIGIVIAAIPLIPFTGGASLPLALTSVLGASALPVSAGIVGLCIAIGGIVVISILTDWEEVEVAGVFKLKRKKK